MTLTIGSLFSGIGGLELGLERAIGAETAWQVEFDEAAWRVLAQHWPDADRSVCDVNLASNLNLRRVDLICGGFPCQDVSSAGNRVGLSGARSGLWFQYKRIVEQLQPDWVVVENVASGKGKWLSTVRHNLHDAGYRTAAVALSAADVGAPHLRRRIFVVANSNSSQLRHQQQRDDGWRAGVRHQGQAIARHDGESRAAADAKNATAMAIECLGASGRSEPSVTHAANADGSRCEGHIRQRVGEFVSGDNGCAWSLADADCLRELQQEGPESN